MHFYESNYRIQGCIYVSKWAATEEWSYFRDPVCRILAELQASICNVLQASVLTSGQSNAEAD